MSACREVYEHSTDLVHEGDAAFVCVNGRSVLILDRGSAVFYSGARLVITGTLTRLPSITIDDRSARMREQEKPFMNKVRL